jgi:hypothetical protein
MSSIVTTWCCGKLHRFLDQQNTTYEYMLQIWTYIAGLWHFCPLLVMLVVCLALTVTCTATAKTSIKRHLRKKGLLNPLFFLWRCDPTRVIASSFLRFLDHTQRRNTSGRTSLDEWSARRKDLCLTTHNTRNRQISMPPGGFEAMISAGERPQTYLRKTYIF